MRLYILDDDINIVKILQNIVESDLSRSVIGVQTDPIKAVDEILSLRPDAVLIDYLMPVMDGPDVIRRVKAVAPAIEFIMLSQVADKEMISDAYTEGLSFFITKPINKIEVNVVIGNLEARLTSTQKLKQIMSLIGQSEVIEEESNSRIEMTRHILQELGIYSEKGAKDMIAIIELKEMEAIPEIGDALERYCRKTGERSKSVKQRMRRAALKALSNVAYIGTEDYMNETFVKYASSLFDFKSIKLQMDQIRGKDTGGGTVSIDHFMETISEGHW